MLENANTLISTAREIKQVMKFWACNVALSKEQVGSFVHYGFYG